MPTDPYAPLRLPDFRRLVAAHGLLTIGREAQIVVVGWQVYERTRDPLALGLIGLAEAIPMLGIALYAGHVADRVDRRRVALAGAFGMLLSAIVLLGFTLRPIATGVWPVYLVIFLSGIARSFSRPSISALSAELVPRELQASGVAWRGSVWQFAAIAGPALGGLIYGFAGGAAAYSTVVVMMSVALVALWRITHRVRPAAAEEEMPIGQSLRIGVRFVLDEPVMLAAMSLDLFSVLFGGATALLPAFATLLGAGPEGLGVLRASPAVGSILIGIWLAHRPPLRRSGVVLLSVVAIFGVTMILFAISRNFWLSFALLFAGGAADNVSAIIRGTLLQTRTPPHLLGRVSAVNGIFIGASNEIGAFESGVAARLMGVVPSVIFGGCMTLVVVAITAWKAPRLRQLREL